MHVIGARSAEPDSLDMLPPAEPDDSLDMLPLALACGDGLAGREGWAAGVGGECCVVRAGEAVVSRSTIS